MKIVILTFIMANYIKMGVTVVISPIHSTSLEMSEVSSETDLLLISKPQQTDAAFFSVGALKIREVVLHVLKT